MHPAVKILFTVYLLAIMQSADSLPQFSVPFVKWNSNEEGPSRIPIRVQNPFSNIFGKRSKTKQYGQFQGSNEVANDNREKIITVTPNPVFSEINKNTRDFIQTTQSSKASGTLITQQKSNTDLTKSTSMENKTNLNEDEKKPDSNFVFDKEYLNKIFGYTDVTTDYNTEYGYSTDSTDYESTPNMVQANLSCQDTRKIVLSAIKKLMTNTGWTSRAIINFIKMEYGIGNMKMSRKISRALKRGVNVGLLQMEQGRYRLIDPSQVLVANVRPMAMAPKRNKKQRKYSRYNMPSYSYKQS